MAEINQDLQKEGKFYNKTFRQFKGTVTQNARNALPEGAFYDLENLQVIGDANIHSIYDISASLVNYGLNQIYWSQYVNLNSTDYLINFATNGNVYAYNIATSTSTLINPGTPLSGAGSRCTQWNDTITLFIDATGYYSWNGSAFTLITGSGVPTSGQDIAVYAGRVWIFAARLLVVGDAGDYTAAAFLASNGAIFISLTDPTLRSTVQRAFAANGYLYFFGVSSINVISNVYVPQGASPPAPLLTNTNIQSTLGTNQPGSFFVVDDRDLYFANTYGIYRLRGVSSERISADIDGTWQYRDATVLASGGAVVSNNILCAAMLMKRLNDPVFGSNTVIAMYSSNRWWFANWSAVGAITFLVGAIASAQPALFAFIGNQLYQLFANALSAPTFTLKTALWPMEDALADKMVQKAGFEATISTLINPITATLDTVTAALPFTPTPNIGFVTWINNVGATVIWENTSFAVVNWYSGQYVLQWGMAPAAAAKYVGMTITGQAILELSGIFMDYKLGNRWGGGAQ